MQLEINQTNRNMMIVLREQLIYSDTSKFSAVLQQVKGAAIDSCVVDLSGLDHIDSSGLRMLLLLHDACKECNAALTFSQARGQVRDMLLHSRFDTIVRIDN
jgi:anti-anti-sigma factor